MKTMANEARHRMSGNNINLEFEHRDVPLIAALGRYNACMQQV